MLLHTPNHGPPQSRPQTPPPPQTHPNPCPSHQPILICLHPPDPRRPKAEQDAGSRKGSPQEPGPTQDVSIGGIFILLPGNKAVLIEVVALPLALHILVNPALLGKLNPGLELLHCHEPVSILIYFPYNLPVGNRETQQKLGKMRGHQGGNGKGQSGQVEVITEFGNSTIWRVYP